MKKRKKKPDPLNTVVNNPETLEQIEAIVGRNSIGFLQEFQHYVNHKISPDAMLSWLLALRARKQAVTLDNLARLRLEQTEIALKNSTTRPPNGRPDIEQKDQREKAKKGGQYYGRPLRSSRRSASATGITSIISVPMGGQPPPRKRKNKRR